MPTFIDRHPFHTFPRAARVRLRAEIRQGFIDPQGVQALGQWVNDGIIHCLLKAPDADAVCRHHAARGLPCSDLHAIEVELGPERGTERRLLSRETDGAVRAAIEQRWPSDRRGEL